MKKFLTILLVLALVLGMGAPTFALEDPVDENVVAEEEGEGEEATEEEGDAEATEDEDAASEEPAAEPFEIPVPERVIVSKQPLSIDGEIVEVQPYNIDGYNYFKLRDLAALLTGTGSQFNVDYEAPNMIVTTGEAYEQEDGDLEIGDDKSDSCVPSKQVLLVDGEQVDILVYNIGGNNYFQLRGLGELVGFEVDYDEDTKTMLVETAVAEDEEGDEEGEDEDGEGDEEGEDEEGEDEE